MIGKILWGGIVASTVAYLTYEPMYKFNKNLVDTIRIKKRSKKLNKRTEIDDALLNSKFIHSIMEITGI